MNRSTLLLFLCVFALSEVLLAAKMARIRGVAGMKNSSGVRLVRTAGCPTNSQCDKMCKTMDGASGGRLSNNDNSYCHCDDDVGKPDTKETCVARCKILGVGS
ncbi:hypothetical protein Ddc_18319 [Ditylenchus destructor]|nr:hypothetical protein Ddc_18319 [Ditylenchus destructor]